MWNEPRQHNEHAEKILPSGGAFAARAIVTSFFLIWIVLVACHVPAVADGGTIRLSEQAGDDRITVLTAPNPFRAGPVEISVLLQTAATSQPESKSQVSIGINPRDQPDQVRKFDATTDASANKLFYAARFELPEAGWWDIEITAEKPSTSSSKGVSRVRFSVEAANPLPRWQVLWPWFSWPALAIALFAIHATFTQRPHGQSGQRRPEDRGRDRSRAVFDEKLGPRPAGG